MKYLVPQEHYLVLRRGPVTAAVPPWLVTARRSPKLERRPWERCTSEGSSAGRDGKAGERDEREGGDDHPRDDGDGDAAPAAAEAGRYFCAWVATCGRRVAWELTTGRQVKLVAGDPWVRRWTRRARACALSQLEGGERKDVAAGLRFLGGARDPRDRALLEARLTGSDDFRASARAIDGKLSVEVESKTRAEADRALAVWDRRPRVGGGQWEGPWQYQRLGTLDVAVPVVAPSPATLREAIKAAARKAKRGEGDGFGAIYLYLVPDGTGEAEMIAKPPIHRARIEFGRDAVESLRAAGAVVHVHFRGVTPGRYWIRVVQDRAAPFHEDVEGHEAKVCVLSVGDLHGATHRVVEAKAGERTVADETACTDPVLTTG